MESDNKYEFTAKSADEAYALLYEAATQNVQIQRVMKMHKSNFPLAFAAVSRYVTDNLKTAAREIREELLAEIRKCGNARAVRGVITCCCQPLLGSWLFGLRWGRKRFLPCTI